MTLLGNYIFGKLKFDNKNVFNVKTMSYKKM